MGPGQRVAVVGAGIAGLAAADALARRGVSVVVLDARNRVGGRIHTVDGVDFGAHWIHGTEGKWTAVQSRAWSAAACSVNTACSQMRREPPR